MKKILFILLYLSLIIECKAQKSLEEIYKTDFNKEINFSDSLNATDYAKIAQDYYNKADSIFDQDIWLANKYYSKSYEFAKQGNNDTILFLSSEFVGLSFFMLKQYDSSILYLQKSLPYAYQTKYYNQVIVMNNTLINYFIKNNDLKKIKYYFNKNDSIFSNIKTIKKHHFITYKARQGDFFLKSKNYDLALKCIDEANEYIKINKIEQSYLSIINSAKAKIYLKMNDLDNVIKVSKKDIHTYKNNQALSNTYLLLGDTYSDKKNIDSAFLYYKKALDCNIKNNHKNTLPYIYLQLSKLYLDSDSTKSRHYLSFVDNNKLLEGEKLMFTIIKANLNNNEENINALENLLDKSANIRLKQKGCTFLYDFFKSTGNDKKSFMYLTKIHRIEDSLKKANDYNTINKSIIKNLFDKEEARNKSLLNKKDRWVMIIIIISLLILSTIAIRYRIQSLFSKKIITRYERLKKENSEISKELTSIAYQYEKHQKFISDTNRNLKEGENIKDLYVRTNIYIKNNHLNKIKDTITTLEEGFLNKFDKDVNFTKTERKLILLLRNNLTSKEIAPLLNVSVGTIEKYRYRIRKKLKVDKKTTLSVFLNNM
jgi:DNA-binding CsgD family transcriptional regulator